jgi:putative copper export protein
MPVAAALALLAGAAGVALQVAIAVAALDAEGGSVDPLSFVTGTHSGILLGARIGLGLAGMAAVLVAIRLARRSRPGVALAVGAAFGLGGLIAMAGMSHAAAFTSPIPAVVDVVHLVAASAWVGGLALLVGVTDFGGGSRLQAGVIGSLVPRFSALAIAAVAVIALTGVYADWVLTGNPLAIDTPYEVTLIAKVAVFLAALGLGATNLLDGGTGRGWGGGLAKRMAVELAIGVAVLAVAANLTSGSPDALDRPLGLAPAASTVTPGVAVSLDVLPGRPGPDRFGATIPAGSAQGVTATMILQRLDADQGIEPVPMRPEIAGSDAPAGAAVRFVGDVPLVADSRWDATIVVSDAAGRELGRRRFVFAVGATGLTEGQATPPVEPTAVLAMVFLALGALGIGFALAGGRFPRTTAAAGRLPVLGASCTGLVLGLAILVAGAPH